MNELTRKVILVLVTMAIAFSATAEVIDTGAGKIEVGDSKVKYGTSAGYNPNDSTKTMYKKLKKRVKDLQQAKKDLKKKKRKAKGTAAKKKVQEEIDKVSKELKKVFADNDFEDKIVSDPRKPHRRSDADIWKRQQRAKRKADLEAKQKKWEEKQRRRRTTAVNVGDLLDLGNVSMGDISSSNDDVSDASRELEDIEDEIQKEECDQVNDQNVEICLELNQARNEASATLEQERTRFEDMTRELPPVLIGAGMYVIYERMTELQDSYSSMRDLSRELIGCEKNCEIIKDRVENLKNQIAEQEAVDKTALNEIQDEMKKEEAGEVDADLVIPNYLAQNSDVPFGNKGELPIIFAVDKEYGAEVVKSAYALVNKQEVELLYYPEKGIFTGSYTGFKSKTDLIGEVQIELVDGQVISKSFKGRINNEKPNVNIKSYAGTTFKRGKFKIHVTGEFDKLEITGKNVKEQIIEFDEPKTSHKMTVKALSKGSASINVVATRTSKTVEMPEFEGETLVTDDEGRILREDDLFTEMDLGKGPKKELGFCCEDIGELTCLGCIAGKRTRKSCKALNKLPGYNFKAFLRAKDLTCTPL